MIKTVDTFVTHSTVLAILENLFKMYKKKYYDFTQLVHFQLCLIDYKHNLIMRKE